MILKIIEKVYDKDSVTQLDRTDVTYISNVTKARLFVDEYNQDCISCETDKNPNETSYILHKDIHSVYFMTDMGKTTEKIY